MVWLVAEKVQKISERISFSSGNIQVNPVESCGKDADHQRKDKTEYLSSDDCIQGISRKKRCGNVAEITLIAATAMLPVTGTVKLPASVSLASFLQPFRFFLIKILSL